MNARTILLTASLLGGVAVALGAFGAHALKGMLTEAGRLETYELAVRYQFYHVLALLATGLLLLRSYDRMLTASAWSFLAGMVLFSGSLYLLCFTGNTTFALVTPVGGLLLIAGWLLMAWGVFRQVK